MILKINKKIAMLAALSSVILVGIAFAYHNINNSADVKKNGSIALENPAVKNAETYDNDMDKTSSLNAVSVESNNRGVEEDSSGKNNDNGEAAKWIEQFVGYKKTEARTLKVPADYGKIQEAVNNANRGDVVKVAEGEYVENIVMKNGVSVEGAGAEKTVIDGNNLGNAVAFKNVRDPKTYLAGFMIRNAGKSLSGISIEDSSPWVHDNIITDNEFGIYIKGESHPVIQKNVIKNASKGIQAYNYLEEKQNEDVAAVKIKEDAVPERKVTRPIIIDNLITDNKIGIDLFNSHADIGHNTISYNNHYKTYIGATYGINISSSSSDISSNIITDNGVCELCAGIIADENSKDVIVGYNDIWNNNNDYLCFGECVLEENNVSENPLYADTMLGDYRLQAESMLIGKAKDGLDIGIRW